MSIDILVDGYKVSPCGIVTSPRGNTLKPWADSRGRYLYINLGRNTRVSIHRLVASVYLPNPSGLPCVNHKDGDPKNNRVNNLEWVDYHENMQHAASQGRISGPYGKQRLTPSAYTDGVLIKKYREVGSVKKMQGFLGCHRTTIGRYMNKRGLL